METEAQREERRLRGSLGIPGGARTVLVLGETSHWDPNWLFTAEEYYERRIGPILDEVLDELEHDPRRIFSIEALFFLQKYWERRPDRHELLRAGCELPLSCYARYRVSSVEPASELRHTVGERLILGSKIEETTCARQIVIGCGSAGPAAARSRYVGSRSLRACKDWSWSAVVRARFP